MIARRITTLRKQHVLSQAQLARKLNISPSALGNYEQGRRNPDLDTLILMSKIFDVSLDYLITGAEHGESGKVGYCPCDTCYWKEYQHRNP